MLSSDDDDVDFADNDNDNGYDGSDILHRPSIGRVYDVHTGKKQLKGAKMSQKVHNVFPYLPPLEPLPGFNLSNADLRIAQLLIAFCSAGGNYYKRTAHFADSEFSYRIFTTDF